MGLSFVALAGDVLTHSDTGAARQMFTESLTIADKTGDRLTLARSLEGLAGLVATDWPERAVRLAGAADAVRAGLGAAAHPAERHDLEASLSGARRALGAATFSASWTAGHALGLPQAVAEALQAAVGVGIPPAGLLRRAHRQIPRPADDRIARRYSGLAERLTSAIAAPM
jgi:hypothetical protein